MRISDSIALVDVVDDFVGDADVIVDVFNFESLARSNYTVITDNRCSPSLKTLP